MLSVFFQSYKFARRTPPALTLFRAVRRASALQLAGDLIVRWENIASESNPADAPSRVQDARLLSARATAIKAASFAEFHDMRLQTDQRILSVFNC